MYISVQRRGILLSVGVALICCAFTSRIAWAEGSTQGDGVVLSTTGGNHGVNRVIRTGSGYRGVKGAVTLSFSMPTNERGTYESAAGPSNRDTDVMPFLNRPTAYLGGEFTSARAGIRTQVDVGLQLEPLTVLGVSDSTQTTAPPGWSIFFNLNPVVAWDDNGNNINQQLMVSPRMWDAAHQTDVRGMPYRGGLNPIPGSMSFTATDTGAASFTFTPFGTIVATLPRNMLSTPHLARWHVDQTQHPVAPWSDATQPALVIFDPAAYADATVKRVAGMTRADPATSELDGSQVVAAWSGCQVQPYGGAFRAWGVGDVDQTHTGYDAPRLDDLAYDRRYSSHPVPDVEGKRAAASGAPVQTPIQIAGGTSRTIVQFSPDPAINDSMLSPTISAANNGRYASETVTINLGMAARPVGSAVH